MKTKNINQKVEWKDLRKLSTREVFIENNLTIPWLLLSLFLAYKGYYLMALPFSAIFFLTGLRQVHNGFHNSLGTNKFLTWLALYANSILMIVSIHAVKYNHIQHHKDSLGPTDYEGKAAKMSWYGAILYGPIHIFMIHKIALKKGNKRYRRNVILELISISTLFFLAIIVNQPVLNYHIGAMLLGECLTAFFAVWTVHHHTEEDPHLPRTQRTWWKNKLTFGMFYHLEHHLFPAVPTIKLAELAKRLDKAVPELRKRQTF